ncbi:hypothetical protein N0V90_009581 [Kalmusia sp. IMI 367209]|nr:hypothetical protein N0V90_009581 [Kalmusia sp. IMI 367209]
MSQPAYGPHQRYHAQPAYGYHAPYNSYQAYGQQPYGTAALKPYPKHGKKMKKKQKNYDKWGPAGEAVGGLLGSAANGGGGWFGGDGGGGGGGGGGADGGGGGGGAVYLPSLMK